MQIYGIFFDLDGTLINTNELIFQSFEYAFHTILNISISREILSHTFGKPLRQALVELNEEHAEALRVAFLDYSAKHQSEITVFPEALETMQRLKISGIRTAIVTSKLCASAKRDLDLFQLTPYFDVFVTPENTARHKPNPEPALFAAQQLGLSPEHTLMVGDSVYDLQCGQAAGCQTAVVSYSLLPLQELLTYRPTYVINHLSDLLQIIKK